MIDVLLVMLAAGVGGLAWVYLLMSINEAREDKRLEDEYDQWANENLNTRAYMNVVFARDDAPKGQYVFLYGMLWRVTKRTRMRGGKVRIEAIEVL